MMKRLMMIVILLSASALGQTNVRANNGTFTGSLTAVAGTFSGDVEFGKTPWIDVRTCGAKLDGVTDDSNAFTTCVAKLASTGGTLYVPPGTAFLNTANVYDGVTTANVPISGSNIRILCDPAAVLKQGTLSPAPVVFGFKTKGSTLYKNATSYAISNVATSGVSSVTTTTAANAGNFAAGDIIYISSGTVSDGAPNAEVNKVLSANASTGVIQLAYPVSKTFTSTPAVANVTAFTETNHEVRGCSAQVYGPFVWESQTIGVRLLHNNVKVLGTIASQSPSFINYTNPITDVTLDDNNFDGNGVAGPIFAQIDTGMRFVRISNNRMMACYNTLSVTEGAEDVTIVNNPQIAADGTTCGSTTAAHTAFSVFANAYNLTVAGNNFIFNGNNASQNAVDFQASSGNCVNCFFTGNMIQAAGTLSYALKVDSQLMSITGNSIVTDKHGIWITNAVSPNTTADSIVGNIIHIRSTDGVGFNFDTDRAVAITGNTVYADALSSQKGVALFNDSVHTAGAGPSITGNTFYNLLTAVSISSTTDDPGPSIANNICENVTNTTGCTNLFPKPLQFLESTAPTGVASYDWIWGDSTDHRLKMNNNNGTATDVAGLADFATPPAIGNTTPAAGSFTTFSATGVSTIAHIKPGGSAPTCASTNIGTSGASCTLQTGSTDTGGMMVFNTTAGATASGVATLTFNSALGTHAGDCVVIPANGASSWNARATTIGGEVGTATFNVAWDNNAVALTSASTYAVIYWCFGR